LFVDAQSGSTNNYSAIFAGGNVGIGTPTPAARLDVAGDINTSTQYNIGGLRALSVAGSNNIFAGIASGQNNTGSSNAFFGAGTGANTSGSGNSFFGSFAGTKNNSGFGNSFVGSIAGQNNTKGSDNTFIGGNSGSSNTVENVNTFIGAGTNGVAGISNSTVIGANATVTQSDSLVLGRLSANTKVGIGTTAPTATLNVVTSSTNAGENTATFAAPTIGPNLSY